MKRAKAERVSLPAVLPLPLPVPGMEKRNSSFKLLDEYEYHDGGNRITIPVGFTCDLASVPALAMPFIRPVALGAPAPLVHDFLYRYAGTLPEGAIVPARAYTRWQADALFLRMLLLDKVKPIKAVLAFFAVLLFGGRYWGGA